CRFSILRLDRDQHCCAARNMRHECCLFRGLDADYPRLINRSKANMIYCCWRVFALNNRPRRNPMLERAIPIADPEMTVGEERAPARPVVQGAIFHGILGRLARVLHAVSAFFAAGGALS